MRRRGSRFGILIWIESNHKPVNDRFVMGFGEYAAPPGLGLFLVGIPALAHWARFFRASGALLRFMIVVQSCSAPCVQCLISVLD
jgi:hypothetical protein